jgi:excisionase family DNA binding protein
MKEDDCMLRTQGYMRVKEAAKLLGVSPNTVRAWGAAGKIPEYRHPANNYRMFKKSDLEKINARIEHSLKSQATQRPNSPR